MTAAIAVSRPDEPEDEADSDIEVELEADAEADVDELPPPLLPQAAKSSAPASVAVTSAPRELRDCLTLFSFIVGPGPRSGIRGRAFVNLLA
jgi:hypothetical protein